MRHPSYRSITQAYGVLPQHIADAAALAALLATMVFDRDVASAMAVGAGFGGYAGLRVATLRSTVEHVRKFLRKRHYSFAKGSRRLQHLQFACVAAGLCLGSAAGYGAVKLFPSHPASQTAILSPAPAPKS